MRYPKLLSFSWILLCTLVHKTKNDKKLLFSRPELLPTVNKTKEDRHTWSSVHRGITLVEEYEGIPERMLQLVFLKVFSL